MDKRDKKNTFLGKNMDGICKLCSKERTLIESHIVPSFIFKWIKKTSVTGFLRSGGNMNQRVQDGYKQYLLCHDCEQKFSNYETYFAQHFFYPSTQLIKKRYAYDEKLNKFVASLIWRIVVINLDREVYKSSPFVAKMYAYEKALRGFLSVDKPIDNDGEFYISFTPLTLEVPKSFKSTNFYFTRMAEFHMIFNKEVAFVYCKLPYFIFVANIFGLEEKDFPNSKVKLQKGEYIINRLSIRSSIVLNLIEKQIKWFDSLKDQISPNQEKKLGESVNENIHKLPDSMSYKARFLDNLSSEE